jgi:hypothetical protein
MSDTIIEVHSTDTRKKERCNEADLCYLRHVRFYPSNPQRATLQIRSNGPLVHGGKSFQCYSSAVLGLEAAVRLRGALDAWIAEEAVRNPRGGGG